MSPRRTNAKRAIGVLIPMILTASLLSSGTLLGQNGDELPDITPVAQTIVPTATVAVLGDGFLSAPSIAPIRPDECATSTNGPLERAARDSPGTAIVVQNVSCVGATLSSIGQQQVGKIDPDASLVVVGGIGLEFDWDTLSSRCLDERTRSAPGCQEEAGVARATAANAFFSWRSLLLQVNGAAPNAVIALVAPPQPVTERALRLGSQCCSPSTDAHAQVRSVFEAASSLRSSVVDSVSDLPVVLVETTEAFSGHLLDDPEPWLTADPTHPGTPTSAGVDALADVLDVLIPVGEPITAPPGTPAEVLLVLGTTEADEPSLAAVQNTAAFWIDTYRLSNVNPTVAVLPIRTSAPLPVTTTTTEAPADALPPVAEVSAPVELAEPVVTQRDGAVLQADEITATFANSGDELAAAIGELSTSAGVSSIADLTNALASAPQLFTPTVADRRVVIRAVDLDLPNALPGDVAQLRTALSAINAEITFVSRSAADAADFAVLVAGTGAAVDFAEADDLAAALPAPTPDPQLVAVDVADVDIANGQSAMAVAAIEVSRPTEATITWSRGGDPEEIVATGQIVSVDSNRLGLGTHSLTVTVATERESISTTAIVRITIDGDAVIGDACRAFDPFPSDIDGNGQPAVCDNDDDGDGLVDAIDPCPSIPTLNLRDIDLDGLPDACDADELDGPAGDSDGDGFPDVIDNCPTFNQDDNQFDADADGIGNPCDEGTVTICTIVGSEGDDIINGTPGNDVICGLGGDDRINGLDGNDTILGGLGNDVLIGSNGEDRLIGGPGDDDISGSGGDDMILGDAGDDTLSGGFGDDAIAGGRGNDVIDGGAGSDIIVGGRGDDVLRGGDGADTLSGNAGKDELLGEAGDDILHGGLGADELGGGRANDILVDVTSIDFARGGTGDDLIGAVPLRSS